MNKHEKEKYDSVREGGGFRRRCFDILGCTIRIIDVCFILFAKLLTYRKSSKSTFAIITKLPFKTKELLTS